MVGCKAQALSNTSLEEVCGAPEVAWFGGLVARTVQVLREGNGLLRFFGKGKLS